MLCRKINAIVDPPEWEKKAQEDRAFYERVLVDGIVLLGILSGNFKVTIRECVRLYM